MDLPTLLADVLGVTNVRPLAGGHQSQVFEVDASGQRSVLKVHDASLVDRVALEARVAVVAELASIDAQVCRPIPLAGGPVARIEGHDGWVGFATCCEYAAGSAPSVADPDDAALIGTTLADLHASMRCLGRKELPMVAALATTGVRADADQILHGDFSPANLRGAAGALRIFDFDDCGYGPPAFDVANTLYMVLFDDLTSSRPPTHRSFEEPFVDGYRAVAPEVVRPEEIKRFVDIRVRALAAWLDVPAAAPIGIRRATPAWRSKLRAFIGEYEAHRR